MKRIAVLFWGVPRRLDLTHESIQKNVIDVLRQNGQVIVTVFQHFYVLRGPYHNRRAKEKDIILSSEQHKLLRPDYFEYDIQDLVAESLHLERYRKMGNPWSRDNFQTLDNFILGSYSKLRVTRMMQDTKITFDYILYLRPDLKILCPFPYHEMTRMSPHNVLVPDFHLFGKYKINDRCALCTWNNYRVFGSHFTRMLRDSAKMKLHSETYIGHLYKKNGITIIYIKFYFNRVRADGREENDHSFLFPCCLSPHRAVENKDCTENKTQDA